MPTASNDPAREYRFGDVEVEPRAHRLSRAGRAVAVEPKAYALLLVLLEHAGEVVERDRLLDAVWGHRHVTPGVLNRCVAQLRKALGDDPAQPRYLQTVHTLGYRFVGELQPAVADTDSQAQSPNERPPGPAVRTDAAAATGRGRHRWWPAAALALLVTVSGALLWWQSGRQPSPIAVANALAPREVVIQLFAWPSAEPGLGPNIGALQQSLERGLSSLPGLRVRMSVSDHPDAVAPSQVVLRGEVERQGDGWALAIAMQEPGGSAWRRRYPLKMPQLGATSVQIQRDVLQYLMPDSPLLHRPGQRSALDVEEFLRSGERASDGARTLRDVRDATSSFRRALQLDPANAEAWCRLGGLYLLGHTMVLQSIEDVMPMASDAIERGIRLDPASVRCQLAQAQVFAKLGRPAQAQAAYRRALRIDPDNYAALYGLGALQSERGEFTALRATAMELVARYPDRTTAHMLLIEACNMTGDVEAARSAERTLYAHIPDARLVNWQGALLDIIHGAAASGIRKEMEYAAADPEDRSYHLAASITASQIGAVSLAAAQNRKAGVLPTPHYLLANVWLFYALDDPQGAIAWLRQARTPPSILLTQRALLAQSLALAGDREQALREYAQVYAQGFTDGDPAIANGVWIWSSHLPNWAALLPPGSPRRREVVDAAADELERMRRLGLKIPWVHYQSAQIALLRGNRQQAAADLEAAIEAGFTDALALYRDLAWREARDDAAYVAAKARLDGIAAVQRLELARSLETPVAGNP